MQLFFDKTVNGNLNKKKYIQKFSTKTILVLDAFTAKDTTILIILDVMIFTAVLGCVPFGCCLFAMLPTINGRSVCLWLMLAGCCYSCCCYTFMHTFCFGNHTLFTMPLIQFTIVHFTQCLSISFSVVRFKQPKKATKSTSKNGNGKILQFFVCMVVSIQIKIQENINVRRKEDEKYIRKTKKIFNGVIGDKDYPILCTERC